MYMLSTVISQTGECNAQHATDPCFLNQWGYSTLLLIIIGIGLVYLLFKKRKFLVDNLKWIAGTVFIAGFLIYWYAFNEGGSDSNSIALTFRSALSSMEMFASHSDLLEVPEDLHHDPFYMTIFSVIHFLAVIVSAVFIIKLLDSDSSHGCGYVWRIFQERRNAGCLFSGVSMIMRYCWLTV